MVINLAHWLTIAQGIVWDAMDLMVDYYHGSRVDLGVEYHRDGPVTAADRAVNQHVVNQLQAHFPDDRFGYLTEEFYKLHPQNLPLAQPWVWVLDPIDGTRDFIEKTGEFTLHLALVHGHETVLALMGVPDQQCLYTAIRGQGCFVQYRDHPRAQVGPRQTVRVSSRSSLLDLKVVVGRNVNYPRFAQFLEAFPVQERVWAGSLGYKVVQILRQMGDVYLSLSGRSAPKDWDLAAPDLILQEAGGRFSREDGRSLRYNRDDVSQWGCLVGSNGPCHAQLCCAADQILKTWTGF